jgi:hypothetical protein
MDQDMLTPPSPPAHAHDAGNHLSRLASEVTSVAAPIIAPILGWMDVINSVLAMVAALGGLYLLYLNIKRARRDLGASGKTVP